MADFTLPKDRCYLTYITFLFHGLGTLLPWNMFINAIDYFLNYKFASENLSEPFPTADYFMQYLIFVSQVPNVGFSWFNVFVQFKGGLEIRMIIAMIIIQAMFVLTIVLAMLNSSGWAPVFFIMTMICVFIINGANAIYQNCLFGIAAKLPFKYTGAIILGNNICGTFTSTIDILSKVGTTNLRLSAIYYFLTAVLVSLLCMDSVYMIKINRFYSFQAQYQDKIERDAKTNDKEDTNIKHEYLEVIKQGYPQFINAFLTLFVTIAIFPAVTAGIQPVSEDLGRFFTSLTCFLTFNVTAMIGSTIANLYQWPKPKYLWICMVSRFVLIPLTLCCNYQPRNKARNTKVLFKSDTVHWILNILNGLTTGYFTAVTMMYAPGAVEPKYAPVAGMLAGAFLITGIFLATCVTFIWPLII